MLQLGMVTRLAGMAIAGLSWVGWAAPGQAVSLNGWDYALGSFTNGVNNYAIGGTVFEFYGIALKDTGSELFVALNTNLPLVGNKQVTYGDLFFNFTGKPFKSASDIGQLFGVRFAAVNSESGAPTLGLYRNVTAKNVSQVNSGFQNLSQYRATVGSNDQFGDLRSSDPYFAGQQTGNWTPLNAIATGTKAAPIQLLDQSQLTTTGLNFAAFPGVVGSQTLGFRFEKSADFGEGDFIANIFAECINDGLAIASRTQSTSKAVPEPTMLFGLALAGSGLSLLKRRQKS